MKKNKNNQENEKISTIKIVKTDNIYTAFNCENDRYLSKYAINDLFHKTMRNKKFYAMLDTFEMLYDKFDCKKDNPIIVVDNMKNIVGLVKFLNKNNILKSSIEC